MSRAFSLKLRGKEFGFWDISLVGLGSWSLSLRYLGVDVGTFEFGAHI